MKGDPHCRHSLSTYRFWIINPGLEEIRSDGEGTRTTRSGQDRECGPGGEITEWEKGNPGDSLGLHTSAKPTEVNEVVNIHFHVMNCLVGLPC